ncbi:TIGR01777 family oxidoreductase [Halomonas sp. GXIMD04776]|uniref:TIGR01777 family oxidoreductase n=1 Tax=Halomonas sp. GXIMD04776 TaxID=3415605 RepID=UPI003C87B895
MRILITGGSGFIGQLLCKRLREQGHTLLVVSRSPDKTRRLLPPDTDIRARVPEFDGTPVDAIVNLAGEPIAGKRWSEEQKKKLVESRLAITGDLVALCGKLDTPPKVMVSGSAMGYYGAQGQRPVDEDTQPHDEFAHRLCAGWEATAQEAEAYGVRVALLRTGLVLDRHGGALKQMLPPFKMGVGGRIGDGRQYMPWIHRLDMVRIIEFLIEQDGLSGPFNCSAPNPVTNDEFVHTLARHLHRPAMIPMPAAVLKMAVGEMSRLLLTGAAMQPKRLEEAGFTFEYSTLDEALKEILGN